MSGSGEEVRTAPIQYMVGVSRSGYPGDNGRVDSRGGEAGGGGGNLWEVDS